MSRNSSSSCAGHPFRRTLRRRNVQKKSHLSANLIQLWLAQFERSELAGEEVEPSTVIDYEARIAPPERKIGRPTAQLDLVKNNRACGWWRQPELIDRRPPEGSPVRRDAK